jgi:hypothetical protein
MSTTMRRAEVVSTLLGIAGKVFYGAMVAILMLIAIYVVVPETTGRA